MFEEQTHFGEVKNEKEKLAQAMGCCRFHALRYGSETGSKICVRFKFQVFAFRQNVLYVCVCANERAVVGKLMAVMLNWGEQSLLLFAKLLL